MKKRWLVLMLVTMGFVAGFLLLTRDYRYVKQRGDDHIVLRIPEPKDWGYIEGVLFTSFDEMKSTIRFGRFTKAQKEMMYFYTRDDGGNIQVYDLDDLYVPVTPLAQEYTIEWYGAYYICELLDSDYHISYEFLPEDHFRSRLKSSLDVVGWSHIAVEADKGALIFKNGDRQKALHEFVVNGITVHVVESFANYPSELRSVLLYGESESVCFVISIRQIGDEPMTRFTLEELKQFTVKKYE